MVEVATIGVCLIVFAVGAVADNDERTPVIVRWYPGILPDGDRGPKHLSHDAICPCLF